ncbi:MAG TPA: (2Fe-2S) ferredoxin domain-containing protein [Allocoleopsis sp.]
MSAPRRVLVCQNKSCRKQGANQVLAALQTQAGTEVQVEASSCLGQCGNGPMLLVLPEEVWYCRVRPDEVGAIAERHLRQGQPIKSMLYRKFHPPT